MGRSKKAKITNTTFSQIVQPDYNGDWNHNIVWSFKDIDIEPSIPWNMGDERMIEFWPMIIDRLREFETNSLNYIFVHCKKQNHSIDASTLNKRAVRRLRELYIETEDIYSLRIGGGLRLYGYIIGYVYYIIWYDDNHGDNDVCVCRSKLKHT